MQCEAQLSRAVPSAASVSRSPCEPVSLCTWCSRECSACFCKAPCVRQAVGRAAGRACRRCTRSPGCYSSSLRRPSCLTATTSGLSARSTAQQTSAVPKTCASSSCRANIQTRRFATSLHSITKAMSAQHSMSLVWRHSTQLRCTAIGALRGLMAATSARTKPTTHMTCEALL